jgi:CRISPR/Cas system-associated exonuclease Cas4 (RecB family)
VSSYYKPHRNPDWNYGGKYFRLSRSKIDLFLECPRCFYVDNKLGVARPPGFPFNLNNAVDELLKKEFDLHRAAGTKHPLAETYGVDAVPLKHASVDAWRDALKRGVECKHAPTGITVRGGIDDVWVRPDGELIVVDYKATSKDGRITELNADWHIGYKRQMEVYQWLFRQNGFRVSDTGYFVYANAGKDKAAFDGVLEFEVTLVPYTGDASWVEQTLVELKACLESKEAPSMAPECDYCRYREAAGKALLALVPRKSAPVATKAKARDTTENDTQSNPTETLF